jgi:hypothetical protein
MAIAVLENQKIIVLSAKQEPLVLLRVASGEKLKTKAFPRTCH